MTSVSTILEITVPLAVVGILIGAFSSERVQHAVGNTIFKMDIPANPFRWSEDTSRPYRPMQRYENYRGSGGSRKKLTKRNKQKKFL